VNFYVKSPLELSTIWIASKQVRRDKETDRINCGNSVETIHIYTRHTGVGQWNWNTWSYNTI